MGWKGGCILKITAYVLKGTIYYYTVFIVLTYSTGLGLYVIKYIVKYNIGWLDWTSWCSWGGGVDLIRWILMIVSGF